MRSATKSDFVNGGRRDAKLGRGKPGVLKPLTGQWVASGNSPRGSYCWSREFTTVEESAMSWAERIAAAELKKF
ncbi:MAG: hypothetical protein M3Y64_10695 [Gemmatimonadota bacterium]|nr:hypothetical protein [Gemmatimonadota bacterium]